MFLDETLIECKAGKGGDGIKSFRREKYEPKGGPDGGNGGRGGHVILRPSHDLHTLFELEKKHLLRGKPGERGGTNNSTGRSGEDLILKVPLGTLVKEYEGDRLVADLSTEEDFIAARGGSGGKGNNCFKSPTNRAPTKFTTGEAGEHLKLKLELKLMADCGLVGFPNAGKSSLIQSLSKATPKIGDYPFTTLQPHLGFVKSPSGSFIMADIPGIIKGAAGGKGLGNRFLRHIERTSCLVYVLDSTGKNLFEDYQTLVKELEEYNPVLLQRPKLILFNKMDLIDIEIPLEFKNENCVLLKTSAATKEGLKTFLVEAGKIVKGSKIITESW